jgi:hypothetical protein
MRNYSLAVSVHLGTSLRYVYQVPKCHKVVHLGLDHVNIARWAPHSLYHPNQDPTRPVTKECPSTSKSTKLQPIRIYMGPIMVQF